MFRILPLGLIIMLVTCFSESTGLSSEVAAELPNLDGKSGKGLEIKCRLVKTEFVVGEPINIWCTVRNTTDSIKPVGWHSNTGLHFCCVQRDNPFRSGVLPRAYPQLRSAIMIKSKDTQPGYILFIPPHESITILLTYKADQILTFKGRIVYDPMAPRGAGIVTADGSPDCRDEWVYSNEFEYEVISGETE